MTAKRLWPVILSGGSGSRLWPVSRHLYPKQLLPLTGEQSLLQQTLDRVSGVQGFAAPIIIANNAHRFLIAEQCRQIGVEPLALILEPEGRNTAPAVALGALRALQEADDAILLVLPSDHLIRDRKSFQKAVEIALPAAAAGKLVAFGIQPEYAETGFGYLRQGGPLEIAEGAFEIAEFTEKPDAATAEGFLSQGGYFWNGGIFCMSAKRYLEELREFEPAVAEAAEKAMSDSKPDLDFERPRADAFASSPSISIDYAVMERTRHAAVVPVDMGWSDLGSWDALWRVGDRDGDDNFTHGEVLCQDTTGSLIWSDGPMVAALGATDHVIVATKDAVLVAPRKSSQRVKEMVARIQSSGRSEHEYHTVVHRPWGSYETTDAGPRFQTKRLVIKPGAILSLQSHHHRAEHWIVVQGTARVTRGDEVFDISENESTFIPRGTKHRLENPGKIPVHIVEVQSGSYLGEDDIVRFEDTYGRGDEVSDDS